MKRQVRLGVFETNSSSEHSIAVVNTDEFKQWQEGKLVARSIYHTEGETTGNFWSYMQEVVFAPSEDKDKLNEEILNAEYYKYYDKDDEWKNYTNPNKLIDDYKKGELCYGMRDVYCTYEEFARRGFDGEDWCSSFSHNNKDGKTIFGSYYRT